MRRDNCKWAKTVYERVLKGLLYEMSETKCRQYLEEELARLVANTVPLQDFVLSKMLKKEEAYSNPDVRIAPLPPSRLPTSLLLLVALLTRMRRCGVCRVWRTSSSTARCASAAGTRPRAPSRRR